MGAQALGVPHRLSRVLAQSCCEQLPLDANSDDFVFDNQMLAQVVLVWPHVARSAAPTKYFAEAPPSTSAAALSTASAASARRLATGRPDGDLSARNCFRPKPGGRSRESGDLHGPDAVSRRGCVGDRMNG